MSRLSFALLPFALASLAGCGSSPGAESTQAEDVVSGKTPAKDSPAEEKNTTKSDPKTVPATTAAKRTGVVFLHGTGDQGDVADFKCTGTGEDFHCAVKVAVDEYWIQATIDSEVTRGDGAKRPYAVLGCPLGSQTPWPNPKPVKGSGAEPGSAVCAAAETARFLNGPDGQAGTDDDITDIVHVTHSGGSNVVRYMLQQHASSPELDRIHKASRGFVGLAAPTTGTYLADWIFRNGSLPNVLNGVIDLVGGAGLYDDDGTNFIQTSTMKVFNKDPAKLVDTAKDVAGVPSFMGAGTVPTASGDQTLVTCAGGAETKALAVLHKLYLSENDPLTSRDGCSDGFISCQSSMALANGDESRVIFGRLDNGKYIGKSLFRAHNQSRRQCDTVDVDVRGTINAIFDAPKKVAGFANGTALERLRFEPASVTGLLEAAQSTTNIRTTRARDIDDGVVIEIEVDVHESANLGVRATLVATTVDGTELTVSSEQAAAPSSRGTRTFSLFLPRDAARSQGERLSVRDVALIRHDDASTLALLPRVEIAP